VQPACNPRPFRRRPRPRRTRARRDGPKARPTCREVQGRGAGARDGLLVGRVRREHEGQVLRSRRPTPSGERALQPVWGVSDEEPLLVAAHFANPDLAW
jgi:hypothetical protein